MLNITIELAKLELPFDMRMTSPCMHYFVHRACQLNSALLPEQALRFQDPSLSISYPQTTVKSLTTQLSSQLMTLQKKVYWPTYCNADNQIYDVMQQQLTASVSQE